jgi:hypothetical protein
MPLINKENPIDVGLSPLNLETLGSRPIMPKNLPGTLVSRCLVQGIAQTRCGILGLTFWLARMIYKGGQCMI